MFFCLYYSFNQNTILENADLLLALILELGRTLACVLESFIKSSFVPEVVSDTVLSFAVLLDTPLCVLAISHQEVVFKTIFDDFGGGVDVEDVQ